MEPRLKKRKKLEEEEKKASWKSLTKKELNDLEKWLEENSMKENSRNLTLADIATHVASTYDIKARHSPSGSRLLKISSVLGLLGEKAYCEAQVQIQRGSARGLHSKSQHAFIAGTSESHHATD